MRIGSDFSGVGAFDQALIRLGIEYNTVFACDMDKYARQTYVANYGEPAYYPENVYNRNIPKDPLDIYMTSPPCQAFSLAGKRKGEGDKRGVLFYNSHEFIQKNKPRYFIFENVKGLLSDDNGKTFKRWVDFLGGKSVNGNPVLFPHEEATPYHIYWKVLNAKDYKVPQNRERVFIIGVRDDADNTFRFPKPYFLDKRLKDVLEEEVDEKYYLSDKMVNSFTNRPQAENYPFNPLTEESTHTPCLTARYFKMGATDPYLKVKSATKSGHELLTPGDSVNFTQTRRGRVGKGVAQTLDTACNQGVWMVDYRYDEGLRIRKSNTSPCVTTGEPIYTNDYKIRRLTPRECFRLMDFPDSFVMPCSDTQMYKQAGNSIVVNVLVEIIKKLNI